MAFTFNPFTGNFDDVADVAQKVTGAASSTDNAIARFDGITGKIVQNSAVTINDSGDMIITGDLTVNGTTTTVNSATLDVTDSNITVNNSGNDASAEGAGLTIERTGTNGSFIYEDALISKFKLGALGSEVEVADISSTQTLTNKTIDADNNTITDIANVNIATAAAISLSKLASLTASRATVTNGSGEITASAVTSTELSYLSGVTSAIQTQFSEKVTGPASATDNALARYDATTGKLIQDSLALLSDTGALSGLTQLDTDNIRIDGNTISSTDTDGNINLTPNGTGIVDINSVLSMSSQLITNLATPISATDAATKAYVDSSAFTITASSGTFTATASATHFINTSGGAAIVTLPAASNGRYVRLKDISGNANVNTITVNTPGAETIDGAASLIMDSNYESKTFVSDGTNWYIL